MKAFTRHGVLVEAGSYVLMRRRLGHDAEPMVAHATLDGVNNAIRELYEEDAGQVACGGVPGGVHYWYVPVEGAS